MYTMLNIRSGCCDHLQYGDNCWFEHFGQDMLVGRDGLSREARQTRNSGLSEGFALLLELAAGSPNLGLCGLLPDLVRACGCKSLPLNQRQVLIELHHASMAAAIASIAIPRPTGD